jgi:hypothetical protein
MDHQKSLDFVSMDHTEYTNFNRKKILNIIRFINLSKK